MAQHASQQPWMDTANQRVRRATKRQVVCVADEWHLQRTAQPNDDLPTTATACAIASFHWSPHQTAANTRRVLTSHDAHGRQHDAPRRCLPRYAPKRTGLDFWSTQRPKILDNQFQVPGRAERAAPADHTIYWPKIAETAESDLICARDELPHDPPAASGPVIRRPERSRRLFPARSSSAERRRYGVRPQ